MFIKYVDFDYVGDLDEGTSIIWYNFTICGGFISWQAMLQNIFLLSTTWAKYIVIDEVVK